MALKDVYAYLISKQAANNLDWNSNIFMLPFRIANIRIGVLYGGLLGIEGVLHKRADIKMATILICSIVMMSRWK